MPSPDPQPCPAGPDGPETRLRAIVEAIPDMLVLFRKDGTILEIDPKGLPLDPALGDWRGLGGRKLEDLELSSGLKAFFADQSRAVLEGRAPRTFHYTVMVEGRQRHREARLVPCEEGSLLALVRDFTEQRESEERLRDRETDLRLVMEGSSDSFFSLDARGRYLSVNPAFAAPFERPPETITGLALEDLFPEEGARQRRAALERAMATGEPQVIQVDFQVPGQERRHYISTMTPRRDALGAITGVFGSAKEITERVRMEEQLSELLELNQKIFSASPAGFLVYDATNGTCVMANQAAAEILGSSVEKLLEKDFRSLASWRESGMLAAAEEALATRQERALDVHYRSIYGKEVQATAVFSSFTSGDAHHLLLVLHDITERLRAEQLERHAHKLESLGLMAGGIAHDFNNLFQALMGNLEVLQVKLPPGHREDPALLRSLRILDKATALSHRMLEYAGKSSWIAEPLDLNALLLERRESLESRGPALRLELALAENLPLVHGDARQLLQVLEGMAANAAEALGAEGGRLEIRTEHRALDGEDLQTGFWVETPPEGDCVCLQVRDWGPGISPQALGRIFDPFFTTREPGRGLGLAAALGILRSHKGGLRVLSRPGQGCSFLMAFEPMGGEEEREREAAGRVTRALPPTILLVDDDEDLRTTLAEILKEFMGMEVLEARDGVEAVDTFSEHRDAIGLVLMDVTMPRLRGVEAFESIRRLRPDARGILMSGFSEETGIQLAHQHGFRSFLKKPFPMQGLQEAVRKAMEDGR